MSTYIFQVFFNDKIAFLWRGGGGGLIPTTVLAARGGKTCPAQIFIITKLTILCIKPYFALSQVCLKFFLALCANIK